MTAADFIEGSPGTFALVSLGCAKNAADLQVAAGALVKRGWRLSGDRTRADVAIVNTCAFIASAREEAESEIARALELKRRGRYGRVVVSGCYPQRYPEAAAKFPGVDSWRGVPKGWEEPAVPALRFTGKAFAYLKIAEGCNRRCAYCAIPSIRGRFSSRPAASILREAEALVGSGCREINIVAQDPMSWGRDLKPRSSLVSLLRMLDGIEGDFWLRVLYSHPASIDADFIAWMVASPHAVRYIDMPVQHTVPEVLAAMGRKNAIDATLFLPDFLRETIPGLVLRTTVMTGHPGETEKRFGRMRADLRRMQFDRLGAFAYSPEKGTASAKLGGRASAATAEERRRTIMADAAALWRARAKLAIGSTTRALVVAPGVARLPSQAPDVDGVAWLLDSPKARKAAPGDFVEVRVAAARGFDFEVEVVRFFRKEG